MWHNAAQNLSTNVYSADATFSVYLVCLKIGILKMKFTLCAVYKLSLFLCIFNAMIFQHRLDNQLKYTNNNLTILTDDFKIHGNQFLKDWTFKAEVKSLYNMSFINPFSPSCW